MPEQRRPIVTEPALDRLVNIAFSGTPDVGFTMRREVRDIPGDVIRHVWNEGLRDYEIV